MSFLKIKNFEPLTKFFCGVGIAFALIVFLYSTNTSMQSCLRGTSDDGSLITGMRKAGPVAASLKDDETMKNTSQVLAELLKKAAMDDNTVVLAYITEAWVAPNSLLDVFLESFHVGDQIEHFLNHMVLIALDSVAFERCKSVHPHCFNLVVEGVTNTSSEHRYKTEDYLKLVWSRLVFQRRILELGFNIIFTDLDIIWFRNPLQHISIMTPITMGTDRFHENPDSEENEANGGFYYIKSTKKMIQFYEQWYVARERFPGEHDQFVFQQIKKELTSRLQIKVRYIDTAYVGCICDLKLDFDKLCTMHATCIEGLDGKLNALRDILEKWKKYKAG